MVNKNTISSEKNMRYDILIWGYQFDISAKDPEYAKEIAISLYNQKPPDGIPVSMEKDGDHIIWRKHSDTEFHEWQ